MKRITLTIAVSMLCVASFGQNKKQAQPIFVWDHPDEKVFIPFNDTVRAVILISDYDALGGKEKNSLSSVNGYMIMERYRYNNGHLLENSFKVKGCLALNKEPFPKEYIIWDMKEVEKY